MFLIKVSTKVYQSRETLLSFLRLRHVGPAQYPRLILSSDQLAENLRQREVPAPLLGSTLEESLQRRCVGYGVLSIIRLLLQGLNIQCRFWVLRSEIGQSILRQGGKELIN